MGSASPSAVRHAVVAVAAAMGVGAAVAGCASGYDSTSLEPYAAADGVNAESGDLRALNVLVVAAQGSSTGAVLMTIANDGDRDDRLEAIETAAGEVQLSGDTTIPAKGTLQVGPDAEAVATVTDLDRAPGQAIRLRLTFAEAEPATVHTVVADTTGYYATVTPSTSPTATPTASAS